MARELGEELEPDELEEGMKTLDTSGDGKGEHSGLFTRTRVSRFVCRTVQTAPPLPYSVV